MWCAIIVATPRAKVSIMTAEILARGYLVPSRSARHVPLAASSGMRTALSGVADRRMANVHGLDHLSFPVFV